MRAPTRETLGLDAEDLVGPSLYADHQRGLDDTVPHGWNYYWKATNLTGMFDEVIDIVAEHAYGATSPRAYAVMFHMGGAVARAPGTPAPTPAATWSTTSASTQHGSPSRTTPSGRRRPRGHDGSSPPSNPTVPAST
jgi:hypothetical protein